jgi:hypothetical protein
MACACGTNKGPTQTYTVTKPDGSKQTYSSEIEAAAAAKRLGGTYRKS